MAETHDRLARLENAVLALIDIELRRHPPPPPKPWLTERKWPTKSEYETFEGFADGMLKNARGRAKAKGEADGG